MRNRRKALLISGTACLALVVSAAGAAGQPSRPSAPSGLRVTVTADAPSVQQYQDVAFTVSVSNTARRTASRTSLSDRLPSGKNLSWGLAEQTGITGCVLKGPVGSQEVSCPRADLAPGSHYSIRLLSHTTSSTAGRIEDSATVTASRGGDSDRSEISITPQKDCRSDAADTSRTLAFDDEFDGDTIDAGKWNSGSLPFGGYKGSTHYHNQQYGSYVEPENSTVHDGTLDLTTDDVPVTDPDVPAIGTIPYTEGFVSTKNKFSRLGGYFETCAKFPAGKGLWPAFWLGSQDGAWPPEMDIAEWFGSLEAMQIGQPFATGANAGSKWQSLWNYSNAPTTGYHSYAMWWSTTSPATIRYYVDGQMVHEIDGTTADLISNKPMYLMLNSGTWAPSTRGGPPDATTVFPNTFSVDYVRVYTAPPPQQTNSAP